MSSTGIGQAGNAVIRVTPPKLPQRSAARTAEPHPDAMQGVVPDPRGGVAAAETHHIPFRPPYRQMSPSLRVAPAHATGGAYGNSGQLPLPSPASGAGAASATTWGAPPTFDVPAIGWVRLASLLIIVLCGANIFWLRFENVSYYWYKPLLNAYSIGVGAFILSRFLIALFYRPPRNIGLEPTVSIVVTAYNEEAAIERTIECCYAVDYPRHKLQVIVVDDGSTDGTGEALQCASRRWPELRAVGFRQNRGKREAMASGACIATGDILVYVDSDSFLRRDALRKIVQGFADPAVAAISGHTEVANRHANMLTRMQEVRYYVAFRIMKAAESVFGAVTCCPGCFSAYRRSCVMSILEDWLHQKFLGVPATFGDDRSLTNYLLRHYKVIYSSDAVATTIVPERHRRFLKQQLRWKKSWLRECLIASSFIWKKHPIAALSFYAQLAFPIIAPLILLRAFVWLPFIQQDVLSMLVYSFGVLIIGCIFSAYYLFWKANNAWIYGAYFTIYYMLILVWQMPYAIATSRDNRWGTR
jgi:hyaluronan synthase